MWSKVRWISFDFTDALASDSSPLQDFCVADANSAVLVNGFVCKDPKMMAGNTSNAVGSRVIVATVAQLPGLNTLGISLARIDYAPWGINPPHTHPRASEILTVLEGCLEVLKKGGVYVFPIGLIHFQRNVGKEMAIAIAALSSQNPGFITIANAVFGLNPDILSDILAKAFQVDKNVIKFIQSKF
ncbi:hypothetical protein I3843_09G138400 [Carya illinoinensis]|uniref:Cupin type-1 domain-containing protein n=1 Tax=Carya illinoinensis TaxID=32201 RepID=A0A8T1PCW6_CARIL|nr:hypothetical protein CIPAW_09G142600 [Carya illinoinensis]KAG7963870.1 hypothetical protein I3843_09G138400 [Carya illinoinensis]